MYVKRKYWLRRGKPPEKVIKALHVRGPSDKNYKYYSKYYFEYYIKYPAKQPSNLPTQIANDIMKARLSYYLAKKLSPPQVFKELQLIGTEFASARSQSNYKYFLQYCKLWSDAQVRASKRNTIWFEA
ncbi:hypothetical protein PsorP6_009625 [Peronosclerospora sorghi]|uniref:Uncharacterized protein n=1 Tax=Peronosclerospora sorghi TaxID=230839 RepID=A0ACC0VY73_9STRA|nr:hypothetical protein PsorP6_009625 [Peronosclerospora sorghi]